MVTFLPLASKVPPLIVNVPVPIGVELLIPMLKVPELIVVPPL